MTTKYLAAVDTDERGIVYAPIHEGNFSTKIGAQKFNTFAGAFQAALDLKNILKKDGFTNLSPGAVMIRDGHEVEITTPSDAVQSPAHYQLGSMEAIDVIDQSIEDPASFYRGNAIKYLLRAGRKGDAHEDLRKARYYIDRELSNE